MLTTRQAFWHCMTLVLGLGTLSIPYTLKQLGWFGLVVLAFLAWLSAHTAKLLCLCIDYVPKDQERGIKSAWVLNSYPDIGEAAYGKKGRTFVNWILYVDLVASSALFLVFIATNLQELFPGYLSQEQWVIAVSLSLLPTVWLQLQKLSFLSTLGSYIMLVLVFTVLYAVWTAAPESLDNNKYDMFKFELQAIGNMVFAFACHGTLLTIYRDMKTPNEVGKLFNQVYFTGYLLKFFVGVSGYYLFAQNTMDQVTLNLPIVWLKMFITIAVSIKKWLTYALPLEPVAVAAVDWAGSKTGSPRAQSGGKIKGNEASKQVPRSIVNLAIRSGLVFLTTVLALFLPKFGLFQALVGSLCAGFLVLIFPILFYLKLYGSKIARPVYRLYIVLLFLCIILVFMATYYSLVEATDVFLDDSAEKVADTLKDPLLGIDPKDAVVIT